jgi:hypothetical protein
MGKYSYLHNYDYFIRDLIILIIVCFIALSVPNTSEETHTNKTMAITSKKKPHTLDESIILSIKKDGTAEIIETIAQLAKTDKMSLHL